jgi:hypothetical protein
MARDDVMALPPNSPYSQLLARQQQATAVRRSEGGRRVLPALPSQQRKVMSQAARNDAQALRIIEFLYREGVSPENITRTLNYHYESTFRLDKDARDKHSIHRIADGDNFVPSVEIWRQP